jgi:hypothetical protein
MSNKIDFKPKLVRRDKQGQFILIEEIINQEETIIINMHVSNISLPNFIKQTLLYLKAQIGPTTMIMEGTNTSLSPIDR